MGFKTMKFRDKYERLLNDNKRMTKKLIELKTKLDICQQKYLSIESAFDLSQKLVQHLKTENQLLRSSQPDPFLMSIPLGPPMSGTLAITDGTIIGDPTNVATNPNQSADNTANSDVCKSDLIAIQYEEEIKELREACDLLSILPLDSVLITYEDQLNANSHLSGASESEYESNEMMEIDLDAVSSKMSETSEVRTDLKCKYCGKKFPENDSFNEHKELHKSSDGKQVRCAEDFCGHQFDSKTELKIHLKCIHKSRVKNTKYSSLMAKFKTSGQNKERFDCKQCNTEFPSIQSLRSHQKSVHNIVSTFKCKFSGCEQKFEKSSELRAHEEQHRKQKSTIEFKQTPIKTTPVLAQTNGTPKPAPTPTPPVPVQRPFPCKFEGCKSSYVHKTSLKKHEEKCHPNGVVPIMGVEPTPNTLAIVAPAADMGTKLQLLNLFFSEQEKQVQL